MVIDSKGGERNANKTNSKIYGGARKGTCERNPSGASNADIKSAKPNAMRKIGKSWTDCSAWNQAINYYSFAVKRS